MGAISDKYKGYFYPDNAKFETDYRHLEFIWTTCFFNFYNKKYYWMHFIGIINLIIMMILFCAGVYSMPMWTNTVYDITSCVLGIIFCVQGITRSIAILLNYEKWIEVKGLVLEEQNYNDEEEKLMIERKTTARYSFVFTIVSYFIAIFMFTFVAVFSSEEFLMPLNFQIPYTDIFSHPTFEICYYLCIYNQAMIMLVKIPFDSTFVMVNLIINGRLKILQKYFELIGVFDSEYDTAEKQTKLIEECSDRVAKMLHMIRLVSDATKLFDVFLMINTTTLVCFCFFVSVDSIINSATWLLIAILWMQFAYCSSGQSVISGMNDIHQSMCQSKWYQITNRRDRQNVLYLFHITQQEVQYSAMGVVPLTMETFTDMIKAACSYYAFMVNVTS